MALSYEDIVQGAYSSIGRTGMGNAVGQVDPEGYNFWLNALKSGAVSPDQLYANFNKSVAETVQQQPQVANSQAVASYIAANPLATQIDPKKVVAVGDSTTWGYNAGNQVADNMVTTAQKALGSDYSVSNLGINSTTAGDFLNSSDFDKALSSGAGTVVLNYGMNEAYRNEDPATFANNLLTAVQTLQAVGKKVILQTPNSTSSTDAWAQNVGAYADVVRNVAQQTGTTLDDKYTYTGTLSNATSAADPVHPTAATYGLLGSNLADAIKTTTTGVAPTSISVTPPKAPTAQAAPVSQAAPAAVQGGLLSSPNNVAAATAPNLKDQLLNQWTQLGIKDLPGGISLDQRAADLAETMKQNGINSLADLKLGSKTVSVDEEGGTAPVGYLTNKGQQLGFLGNVNENLKGKADYLQPDNLVSWTSQGGGNVGYTAVQTADGGVAIVPQWNSSSDMKQVRDAAKMIAAVYGVGTGLEGLGAGAGVGAGAGGLSAADLAVLTANEGAMLGAGGAGLMGGAAAGLTAADLATLTANEGALMGSGLTSAELASIYGAGGISAADLATLTANEGSLMGAGLTEAELASIYGAGGISAADLATLTANEGAMMGAGLTAAELATLGLGAGGIVAGGGADLYADLAGAGTGTNTGILSNLTASQIANLVTGGVGLLGGAAAINAVTPSGTTSTVGALPTQGVPLNTADYYQAIQQNYNKILPAMPRDVATPLAQWYNSTYGA
jgi:lysophospholipase L1-like esterase